MNSPTLPDLSALRPARKRAARAPAQRGPEPPLPGHPLWESLPRDAQDDIARLLRPDAPSEEACERLERLCAEYGFRQCRLERFWDELNSSWGWYGPHGSWEAFREARRAGRALFMQEVGIFLAWKDKPDARALTLPELPRSPRAFFRALCGLHASLRLLQEQHGDEFIVLASLAFQNFHMPADVFLVFNREFALAAARLGQPVPSTDASPERFIYADDIELARAAVVHRWTAIDSFSERVRDDFEAMRLVLRGGSDAFMRASARLRGNVTFCLLALQADTAGYVYDEFLEPAKSDPEVVVQLVRSGRWVPLLDILPSMVDRPAFFFRLVREFPATLRYFDFLWLRGEEFGDAAQFEQLYVNLAVEALARNPGLMVDVPYTAQRRVERARASRGF